MPSFRQRSEENLAQYVVAAACMAENAEDIRTIRHTNEDRVNK